MASDLSCLSFIVGFALNSPSSDHNVYDKFGLIDDAFTEATRFV